ncbi:MAG: Na+/H+ antiporter NhaC family protein [Bacteroidetes bacterium]|nr:Na+/H+ antiporter NhaC family protein [Bacteroidota bacterium]
MNEKGMVIKAPDLEGKALLTIAQEEKELVFEDGIAFFPYSTNGKGELVLFKTTEGKYTLFHISKSKNGEFRLRSIPLWLSILPPLIAILFALLFKEVIVSLFTGILAGSFIAGGLRIDSFYYFFLSFFEVVQKYVLHALDDTGHLSVIIFSLLIGGMVAIISRNGGMAGVVASLSRYARSPRSSQFITWLLGVAIFFDDYANTLIVGNTMRSVTDKFRISREKLAYIVDSTAAPVVAIAFITTWIGAELGYIADGMKLLDGFDKDMTPYAIFISSLKYSFYPVLTLIFILILIYTKRDYGEMYTAEMRARTTGKVSAATKGIDDEPDMEDLSPVKGAPLKWYNAAIPVLVVIFGTIFGLWDTGIDNTYSELVKKGIPVNSESWGDVWAGMSGLLNDNQSGFFIKIGKLIGNSDSFIALLWASVAGVTIAIFMTVFGRIMKVSDTMHALTTGFKTMMPAIIILTLAWSLAITTEELYTANFLTSILKDSLNPYAVPVLVFILAALISFSTGSSWSTMAILYPIAIPTTWAVCMSQGMDSDISLEILLNVIAVVLAASVLGDHCSPISDTTILSSLASDCNHIDHVRTQLPYALTVGSVSLIAGGLSTLLGGGWFISSILLLISIAVLALVIWKFGKKVE